MGTNEKLVPGELLIIIPGEMTGMVTNEYQHKNLNEEIAHV